MKNIVLIGMPATGKSTVGVILAKLLGYNFIDTDILLALEQKKTLSQIISANGYDKFIESEGKIGESLKCEKTVIATGGSMIFSENAIRRLSENGIVIWLDTPVEELERRMVGTLLDRGVAAPSQLTLHEIFEIREPLYKKYAQLRILCTGTSELVATRLREMLINEKLI
ncbi:MAG: shikimate kinase [Firmicutes bacterium HGW-Firmicutes-16]|nr:MAG: shikimate kinase [Firmicutes bacterium HGW-Firmicutes-16]